MTMSKRDFRQLPRARHAAYPTLDDFDLRSRRDFLGKLGALGAVLLGGSALAACDHRAAPASAGDATAPRLPDGGPTPRPPDGGPAPDSHEWPPYAGGEPQPPAQLDAGPRKPDAKLLEGDIAGPDARIDGEVTSGFAPAMDARIDGCSNPGPEPNP
jgi:hypothetical protein